MRRVDLAGAAHMELVCGVVQLRPEDATYEAMVRGWRAQRAARGLREDTIGARERLMRRFSDFTNEYPWAWQPSHVDEWSLSLTTEGHLAPSTVRAYQCSLRSFNEYLCDNRYGWVSTCQEQFGAGVYPVAVVHEWNTIPHLNDYEGNPEARPFSREELQRFLDYVRPRFGCAEHPALWVTERGGRIKPAEINARFVAYRDALGLPKALVPHSMRHSYVSHMTEDGVGRRFIQCQVGHEVDSSTAVYTHVSSDFMNTALRRALAGALGNDPAGREH